jgi:hypothetical protein
MRELGGHEGAIVKQSARNETGTRGSDPTSLNQTPVVFLRLSKVFSENRYLSPIKVEDVLFRTML